MELRGRIFGAFELAECEPDPEVRRAWLTFVVVGAGPTGVELAGQIAELAHRSLRGNFRRIDPAEARVVLLDAPPPCCRRSPSRCSAAPPATWSVLASRSRLGAMVTGVDELGLDTSSDDPQVKRIDAITKIWAAGVQGSPLGRIVAEAAGAGVDRAGRVQVQPDLTLPGHPEVFVVGDLMSLNGLPGVAQVAIQSGRHAAQTIVSRLRGDTSEQPFRYSDKGTLATISRFRAVASVGRIRLSGFLAWMLWLAVHLIALTGFKNRVAVLFNWTVAFLGRGRQQRTITTQQVFARQSLESQAGQIRIPSSSQPVNPPTTDQSEPPRRATP